MYIFVNLRIIFQILLALIFYVSAPGHLLVLSIWLTYWPWSRRVSVTIKYNQAVNISRKGILGLESAKNSRLYPLLKLGSGCRQSRGNVQMKRPPSGLCCAPPSLVLVVMAPSWGHFLAEHSSLSTLVFKQYQVITASDKKCLLLWHELQENTNTQCTVGVGGNVGLALAFRNSFCLILLQDQCALSPGWRR